MSDAKASLSHDVSADASAIIEMNAAERKFLHDLSNPLAIALGMMRSLKDSTTEADTLTEDQARRLLKAITALEKISELLTRRRAEIVVAQDAASQGLKKAS